MWFLKCKLDFNLFKIVSIIFTIYIVSLRQQQPGLKLFSTYKWELVKNVSLVLICLNFKLLLSGP